MLSSLTYFRQQLWCFFINVEMVYILQIMVFQHWIECFSVGADPEETILNAFKVFDPEGKGILRKE